MRKSNARIQPQLINTRYVTTSVDLCTHSRLPTDCTQSMTKVKDIHTTPLCVKHSSRRSNGSTRLGIGRSQASQARLSDLPPGTANHFSKKVLPLVFDAAGVLGPWECPNDNKIIVIWNLIFGSPNDHPIASSDVNGDLFLIVKYLVRCPLYSVMLFTIICPDQGGHFDVASQICHGSRKGSFC